MTTFSALRDPIQRRILSESLKDLPFENLWLRISGFGSDATGMGVRRYIAAVFELLRLGKPIIADTVAGLAGVAAIAFGAVGGIAHGVAEKERFDASNWDKPRSAGGGGNERRILLPGIDRLLNIKQMEALMAAPSGRRFCSCNDRSCCPHGWEDTLKDPKGHYLHQRAKQIQLLAAVPETRRADHFLQNDLAQANRESRKATRIRVQDDSLREALLRSNERIERMSGILEELHKTIGDGSRSTSPSRRSASKRNVFRKKR
jgi:hypothetical protein